MTSRILVVGTDEAGYGPNLGPLVVSSTAWWMPAEFQISDLWQKLDSVVRTVKAQGDPRLHVADSKQVYSRQAGLGPLERSVLTFLRVVAGDRPKTVRHFGELTSSWEFCNGYDTDPCHFSDHTPLPVATDEVELDELSSELQQKLQEQDIELAAVSSRVIFPAEFNVLCECTGSKGALLSEATIELIQEHLANFSDREFAYVCCDKHGGRNRYDELIAEHSDDAFVFRIQESRSQSRYRVGDVEYCFRTKAEEHLPVALASMFAKYTRELIMGEFNTFWKSHVPGLRPTQGYPVDAARFRDSISDTAAALGIPESQFWRSR